MTIEDSSSAEAEFRISDRIADHWESSNAAQVLKRLQANPRIKYIALAVPVDACPVCQKLAGTYLKEDVPHLPVEMCSHPLGCRSNYVPSLEDIFP